MAQAGLSNRDIQGDLNGINPVANKVQLGALLQELIDANNDLATKYNALLAKLDADAGITDTNYAATLASSNTDIDDINDRA